MNTIRQLEVHRDHVRDCTLCFPDGGNAPVVDIAKDVRVLLIGQAPGITEVTTRLPFTGPAGKRLMQWFERAGIKRDEVYFSALARCFPGKAKGGGDKAPSRAMIRNCGQHLEAELEILNPAVVILVGGMAIKEILSVPRMTDVIGEAIERDGVTYVPLPHPSGASTWLNAPENKKSLERSLKILGSRTKKAERENNA